MSAPRPWQASEPGTRGFDIHKSMMEANGPIDNDAAFAKARRKPSRPVTSRERALRRPREV